MELLEGHQVGQMAERTVGLWADWLEELLAEPSAALWVEQRVGQRAARWAVRSAGQSAAQLAVELVARQEAVQVALWVVKVRL